VIIFKAKNDDSAINKAIKISKKEGKDIVQIGEIVEGRFKAFYDFMNGKYKT
jgi:hypothetical protein